MHLRSTAILLALALAAVVAVAVPLVWKGSGGETDALLAAANRAYATRADVALVEVERADGGKVVFRRATPTQWRMEAPTAARASAADVDRLIDQVLSARKGSKGEPSRDLTQYKLARPAVTVTLKKGDGSDIGQLRLGTVVGPGEDARVYATSSEQPSQAVPVAVTNLSALLKKSTGSAATAADLLKPANDFRSKSLLAEGVFRPEDAVQTLTLRKGKGDKPGETVQLVRGSDNVWRYATPAGYGEVDLEGTAQPPLSTSSPPEGSGLRALLGKLTGDLAVAESSDFVDDPKDLKEYGLDADNPDLLRIEIVRKAAEGAKEPITEVLLVGKKADEKGDKLFAKLQSEPAVVKVPAKAVEPFRQLLTDPSKLRSRDLVTLTEPRIDGVVVKANSPESFTVTLRKVGGVWKLFDAKGEPANANAPAVSELLAALTKKGLVAGFPPAGKPDAETGLDKPAVEVSLWEEPKEKTGDPSKPRSDPPTVKLLFGRKDKDVLYVRKESGGASADVLVPESLLKTVTRPELEYLDPNLPSFEPDKATKLVIAPVGGETTEVEQTSGVTWAFKQPAARAGRPAGTDNVLKTLRNLAALSAKPFAREADAGFLMRNGLEPAKLKVTVTVKNGDKTEEKTYLFGNDAPDFNVYGKQADKPLVYLVPKSATVPFTAPELSDPTVFPGLELAKVKAVKLTGWANLTGSPVVLDLERKGANDYAPRDPKPAFTLDGAKVERFVQSLVGLKAEEFLSHTNEVKPEYGLPPDRGAMVIEVTLDGVAEPLALTLGSPDERGRFRATAKQLPGDVFVLPAGRPEKDIKSAPTWFEKR